MVQIFLKKQTLIIILSLFLYIPGLFSQSDQDCYICHEDVELTTERNGKTVSMFVNSSYLEESVHNNMTCISCHKDANVKEFPHNERLKRINCISCHRKYGELAKNDIHSRLKQGRPNCKTCHGTHNIVTPANVGDKSQKYCGSCHDNNTLTTKYHVANKVNTANNSNITNKVNNVNSNKKANKANERCKECHEVNVYKTHLAQSVHEKLLCNNCHGNIAKNIDAHTESTEGLITAECNVCHKEITLEHKESIHGLSISEGINEAANCWDCHGSHYIHKSTSDSSKVYPSNLVGTCGTCHDDPEFSKRHYSSVKQPGKMYSTSVHGKLVESGRMDAASCATCHGIHDIKNRIQTGSTISAVNLPETCSECHKEIAEEYKQSIHWIAVKKGVRESPTCNDCHSEHSIHAINTIDKREEIKKIQEETCLHCHQDLLLSERYGLEGKNAAGYQDSYHGLAVLRGDENAAMCVDCHGVHNILPKFHELSTIHDNNVVQTCKECHLDATEIFSKSYSHITDVSSNASFIEKIVRTIYFWIIIIVIGGMIIHNMLIFLHDVKLKYKRIKNEIRIPRFTTNELIQHLILFISFVVLAITGFQLKFPDSWWSEGLTYIGLDEVTRQIMHRISAVIMIALSLYHVIYLIVTSRGRDVFKGLAPKFSDFKLAIQNILYYINVRKKHPEFDNYNYIEKAEYWALVWGTVLMGGTGFILWFPTIVGNWAPVWLIKVSEIVHFYEAILATLAIIVWHLFFVVFRPKQHSMSFISVDGKMTFDHFKEEHKLKFKNIIVEWLEVKKGKRDANKMSHFSKMFISELEKRGINILDFFQTELDKDADLKRFIQEID